jgi:hypothetical protein
MIRTLLLLTVAPLAVLTTAIAHAQTVFFTDAPNYGYFSQGSGPGSGNYSATDFYLNSAATLTNVTWWGTDGNGGAGSNQFTIQLFTDDGSGNPNTAPVATFSIGTPSVTDTGMQNGQYNPPGSEVYQYSANLTTSYSLAGTTQYYIGITEIDPNDPWSWQYGSDNNNNYYRSDTSSAWGNNEVGLAFQLSGNTGTTPEPGTYALLGSLTLTGAAFLRRRRTR